MSLVDPDGRERDRLGRVQPGKLNVMVLSRAVPGMLALFTEKVQPRRHAGGRRGVADRSIVAVMCKCGARVPIKRGTIFHPCEGCNRWYLELGGRIRCAVLPPQQDEMSEAA